MRRPTLHASREPPPEARNVVSAAEAARCLGITVTTLYDWLGQSDHGLLMIRGQPLTIDYFQGGARGQGRIRIEVTEVERILEQMRVQPTRNPIRRAPIRQRTFPGITVELGRPDGMG